MSTLNVSNITDGTTTVGTSYVVNGSAKAWVNFNGQGTIAIRESLNVSSLTDRGTGQYTVNFSSAFADANYSAVGMVRGSDGTDASMENMGLSNPTAPTSSGAAIAVGYNGTFYDCPTVNLVVHR